MASAVDYLVLTVVHRTNEDWFMTLPVEVDGLEGATAVCQLVKPNSGDVIHLDAVVQNGSIVLHAESEVFLNKSGGYSGDVLLTLSGGRDFVTHLINLNLQKGVSQRG